MKGKIIKIRVEDNAQIIAVIQLTQNNGKIVYEGERAFVSLDNTAGGIRTYLKQTMRNIANEMIDKKASKLKEEAEKLIGQEIDLDT